MARASATLDRFGTQVVDRTSDRITLGVDLLEKLVCILTITTEDIGFSLTGDDGFA